jgi:tetratricopeptide (TPR) repeat protein
MYKYLFFLLIFFYSIVLCACLTTVNNEQLPDEICDVKPVQPEAYNHIWLINKNLPLPSPDFEKSKANAAEAQTAAATPALDPHGLPLPLVADEHKESVKTAAKPEPGPQPEQKPEKTTIKKAESPPKPSAVTAKPSHPVNYSTIEPPAHKPAQKPPEKQPFNLENEGESAPSAYETQVKSELEPARTRNVFARRGDDIQIVFDDPGWIFSGFTDGNSSQGVGYLSKDSKADKTLFNFKAIEYGSFGLEFQLQDNIKGTSQKERITVKVVTEDEFSTFLQNDSTSALDEYLKLYREGDTFLNNRLADIYYTLKDYRRAIHYWKKNLGSADSYRRSAIAGLSRAYITTDNFNELVSHMRYLFNGRNVPEETDLLSLAEYFTSRNADKLSLELLNEYISSYPYGKNVDEIYYLLGVLYEKQTDFRDYKKSRDFYQKIISDFPESRYADPARERVDYLNRHFFYVR